MLIINIKNLIKWPFFINITKWKEKRNWHSFDRNEGAEVGGAFSEDVFLIIPFHWPSFYFLKTSIIICSKDLIEKSEGNNPGPNTGIVDRDIRADD